MRNPQSHLAVGVDLDCLVTLAVLEVVLLKRLIYYKYFVLEYDHFYFYK